ncbi:type II toxin-antitoxin system RelE/ParE family toxin [bacterium]|nr:type II toxin-antitoxin system RelE/ParE family toxin [bacterium]MBU1599307.1 type II toxin-antitoxin system RelE/ParE family toxin [bacterium]MBU2462370.1 type II toxin-antitoxin system RelE/ParE family toxin [bacterium]
MSFKVRFSKPFKRSLRHLVQKYRQVQSDLESAIEVLLFYPDLGKVIPNTSGVRKLRVASSNMAKGKRGGFRLLYLVDKEKCCIALLFVYAKSEKKDISRKELESIIEEALRE